MNTESALIIVDVQNDFIDGTLAVPGAIDVLPVINRIAEKFDLLFATQDWHKPDHCSFAVTHKGKEFDEITLANGNKQKLWPVHCVLSTFGANLHVDLVPGRILRVIQKGKFAGDGYSGFWDDDYKVETALRKELRQLGVKKLFVVGLALDYCVKYTAMDALELGYEVYVVEDACRAVGDKETVIEEMRRAGVKVITEVNMRVD